MAMLKFVVSSRWWGEVGVGGSEVEEKNFCGGSVPVSFKELEEGSKRSSANVVNPPLSKPPATIRSLAQYKAEILPAETKSAK